MWWKIISAWGKVRSPPTDSGLHKRLFHHAAWLRGRTLETAFQTTCRENAEPVSRLAAVVVARGPGPGSYRLQDCHRHLKFWPAFLAGSGGCCCTGGRGLWLPLGDTGGGEGVTVGCEKRKHIQFFLYFFLNFKTNVDCQAKEEPSLRTSVYAARAKRVTQGQRLLRLVKRICLLRCNRCPARGRSCSLSILLWEVGISESHMVLSGLTFLTST